MKNLDVIIGFVIVLVVLMFGSCEKEEIFDQPVLPPQTAFVIDFSDFDTNLAKAQADVSTTQNFGFAAGQVFVWRVIIAVGLAVPVASYNYALEQTPTMIQNNKWLWTYNLSVNQDVYNAKLYGTVTSDSVFWEMYLSKTAGGGQFSEYKWYTGAMNKTVTDGYWILNDNPVSNKPILKIDWDRNTSNQTWSIKYMNIVPDGVENGGFILHGDTTDPTFGAFFTIFNKGQSQTTNIEWNRTTIAGRVNAQHFFGDSNWRCWDHEFQDMDCSN